MLKVNEMIYAINTETKDHRIASSNHHVASKLGCYLNSDEILVEADREGWIAFDGNECPLPPLTKVQWKGKKSGMASVVVTAGNLKWKDGIEGISAYRPVFCNGEISTADEIPEIQEDKGVKNIAPNRQNVRCFYETSASTKEEIEIVAQYGDTLWVIMSGQGEPETVWYDDVEFIEVGSESRDIENMCHGLAHAARVLEAYAGEHENPDRAFGARAVEKVIRHKIEALKDGRITPDFIRKSQ